MPARKLEYSFYGTSPVKRIGSFEAMKFLSLLQFIGNTKLVLDDCIGYGFMNKTTVTTALNKLPHRRTSLFNDEAIELALSNLRSSWFDELSFFKEIGPTIENEKIKFPSWCIIKFYYTLYHSLSAIVRTIAPKAEEQNHSKKIKIFNGNILTNKNLNSFFLTPFNVLYDSNTKSFNFQNHCSNNVNYSLEDQLSDLFEFVLQEQNTYNSSISVFNFYKLVREYVNYNGTFITSYLYGHSVIRNLKKELTYLVFYFQVMTENYFIAHLGRDQVKQEYKEFKRVVHYNFNLKTPHIDTRFSAYSDYSGF